MPWRRQIGPRGTYAIPAPRLYEFELDCTGGVLRAMNNGAHWMMRKALTPEAKKVQRRTFWEQAGFPEFERESSTLRCVEDLIESIETGRPSRGNPRVAMKTMEISMGIAESHRLGNVPVSLPIENRSFYIPAV